MSAIDQTAIHAGLKDKVAVITGGGHGLGQAIAMGLARAGCRIVILGRTEQALDETAARIEAETGRPVLWRSVDISHPVAVRRFADDVLQHFGRVDILVNNASGWISGTLNEPSDDEVSYALDVTVKGPIWCSRAFWSPLALAKPGFIFNVTTLGARPFRSNASPVYVAAKFANAGFTDALRRLAIKDGIRVIEILPGTLAGTADMPGSNDAEGSGVVDKKRPGVPFADYVDGIVFALTRSGSALVEEIAIASVDDYFEDYSRY